MNIQKYIESGILEQYVLGELSPQERQEVENYAAHYPAIKAEMTQIEKTLEQLALAAAVAPPVGLEQLIMQQINNQPTTPTPTRSRGRQRSTANFSWMSLLLGLGLAGSLFANYLLSDTNTVSEKEIAQLNQQNQALEIAKDACEKNYEGLLFKCDPNTQKTHLKGDASLSDPKPYTGGDMIVYNNVGEKRTAIAITDLPAAPAGKVYHLWAVEVVDGNLSPHDIGTFQSTNDSAELINVSYPEGLDVYAFAVTLENAGAISGPDLTQMYVLGAVGS